MVVYKEAQILQNLPSPLKNILKSFRNVPKICFIVVYKEAYIFDPTTNRVKLFRKSLPASESRLELKS